MEKRIELERRARKASQITDLNLDNCRSTSIVGLTDEYTALETLSLINVGLTTLKGFPKLPNLRKLELSDNRISNGLNYLHTSPKLEYLNLSGNKIKDLEALKPLEEFKQLAILDLFNNEATQIDNYREKIFEILPSLKYLDGFDCNDDEVPSEADDDEENGYYNDQDDEGDDKQNVFNINGLEIDLDELEEFEKRLKTKRDAAAAAIQQQSLAKTNQCETAETKISSSASKVDEVDELDEYLKTLKLKEAEAEAESKAQKTNDVSSKQLQQSTNYSTYAIDSQNRNLNFGLLLYWFLAILNMASATFYSEYGGSVDSLSTEDCPDSFNEVADDVSLSEVLNEDLEDDEDEWDEENADYNDDDDLDSDDEEANTSAASADAADAVKEEGNAAAADGAEEESQARGKKRKHEG